MATPVFMVTEWNAQSTSYLDQTLINYLKLRGQFLQIFGSIDIAKYVLKKTDFKQR